MNLTRDELGAELAALASKSTPLTASEERKGRWLLAELGGADVSAAVDEVRALYDDWLGRDPAAEQEETPLWRQ